MKHLLAVESLLLKSENGEYFNDELTVSSRFIIPI